MRKRRTRSRDCAALRANVSEAFWQYTHDSLVTLETPYGPVQVGVNWTLYAFERGNTTGPHEAYHFDPLCKYLI